MRKTKEWKEALKEYDKVLWEKNPNHKENQLENKETEEDDTTKASMSMIRDDT